MQTAWFSDTVTTDLARAVHYALLWGLDGIVLRTVGGPSERVPFVNEAKVKARLADAELPVVAVAPGLFEGRAAPRAGWMNDLMVLDDTAAFCRRLACPLILVGALAEGAVGFDPKESAAALRRAAEIAAKAGLRLAVLNEAGTGCASGEALAALLGEADHPALGAAWSPADALEAGHDPEAGLDALLDTPNRVAFVSTRDGTSEQGVWHERLPGEGGVGWPAQLARLAAAGFDGALALDLRGPMGDGKTGESLSRAKAGLRAATALIGLIRAEMRRV